MPVEDAGGHAGKTERHDARLIAGGWHRTNHAEYSDIGRSNLEARLAASSCGPLLQTRQSREALLGKVANLLTVRQNIFTIVLAAELAGQESGRIPRMPVRQRAVAIVWRDPYLNQFFVRSFRYLGD